MGMLLLHLLVLVMLMTSYDVSGLAVCTAIAMVYESATRVTNVTCYFGQSISGNNFNVQFFPTPESDPEIALVCNRQGAGLLCKRGEGVVFDDKQQTSDRFSLTMSSSTGRLAEGAQYLCQAVPQLEGPSHRCHVHILHMPPTPAQPMLPVQQGGVSSLEVITFLIIMLIIIVVIVAIVIVYKRKDRIRQWCLGPLGDRWPGVLENGPSPEEAAEESCSQTSPMMVGEAPVPEGLPRFFYNLGQKAAGEKDRMKKMEEETSGAGPNDVITIEAGRTPNQTITPEDHTSKKKGCTVM